MRTAEGRLIHERAHDATFIEKRRGLISVRDMRIFSGSLGISGACDVVEFISDENGIPINGREGKYKIRPVEYKHGEPKGDNCDELQLAAQAMCLEEMLCCDIEDGAIYYAAIRRRVYVEISEELRKSVRDSCTEMHDMFSRAYTPKVKPSKSCNACSLKNLCLPKLMKKKSAANYLKEHMEEV